MSDIPEARRKLLKIADQLTELNLSKTADRIREIVAHDMTRPPVTRQGRRRYIEVTPEIEARVEAYRSTKMTLHEIAVEVGIPPGLISKIMRGAHRAEL